MLKYARLNFNELSLEKNLRTHGFYIFMNRWRRVQLKILCTTFRLVGRSRGKVSGSCEHMRLQLCLCAPLNFCYSKLLCAFCRCRFYCNPRVSKVEVDLLN